MPFFDIISQTNENTVVTEYTPTERTAKNYQSEAELEKEFINILCNQGYEYINIHTENDLIENLRNKIQQLNNYTFSDDEWQRFFKNSIANNNDGIKEKSKKIQEDYIQVLKRDDGTSKNISLIDKKNIHNNKLQVINQYVIGKKEGANYDNRYDVTVLINGLPMIHIELKRRGVAIREAFNQINRYKRDSFWQEADFLNIFKFSLYQTVQIQSIIQILLVTMLLKKQTPKQKEKVRQVIVLSLHLFGQTVKIK